MVRSDVSDIEYVVEQCLVRFEPAFAYPEVAGITPLNGDCDGDGLRTFSDAVLLFDYLYGRATPPKPVACVAENFPVGHRQP